MNGLERFCTEIKVARVRAGLSQGDTAVQLGYSTPQFISNWERGISLPPPKCVSKLALLYRVEETWLRTLIRDAYIAEASIKANELY